MPIQRYIKNPSLIRKLLLDRSLGSITNVRTTTPVIALTFDDGPDAVDTPRLLDLLDHHKVRATFFVLGVRAKRHPDIIARMVKSKHAIGNHGWSHASMPALSAKERRHEIRKTYKALKPHGSKLFRPPFGHMDWPTRRDVLLCGFKPVTWNIVAYDWIDRTDGEILESIESGLNPGSIVLLHDSLYTYQNFEHRNREPLLSALDQLIQKTKSQYSFVTVPELLRSGKARRVYWLKRGDNAWLNSQIYSEQ